jgi:hypothetical protein
MATSSFKINKSSGAPAGADGVGGAVETSTLDTSRFDDAGIKALTYPNDLLRDKIGPHEKITPFMAFYVMVPFTARATKENEALDDTSTNSVLKLRGLDYAAEVNQLKDLEQAQSIVTEALQGKERIRIFRRVNILKKMICLYMPDTLNSDLNASYNNFSVGSDTIAQIGSTVDIFQSWKNGTATQESVKKNLTNLLAGFAGGGGLIGGVGTAFKFVQAGQGTAINPLSEVFFDNMAFRQFNFDFKFMPRSKEEVKEVREIIDTFRAYMVPEIDTSSAAGIFFSVPAFFQIKYYIQKEGMISENDHIPKISGCALTAVSTDMAPEGVALHKDGAPVAIRMQLSFTELEIMHRDRIKQGY